MQFELNILMSFESERSGWKVIRCWCSSNWISWCLLPPSLRGLGFRSDKWEEDLRMKIFNPEKSLHLKLQHGTKKSTLKERASSSSWRSYKGKMLTFGDIIKVASGLSRKAFQKSEWKFQTLLQKEHRLENCKKKTKKPNPLLLEMIRDIFPKST